ncbi:MAG: Cof-type HAD-IIB family hydrolase [Erysipelotrichaceae bacterium]
MEKIKIVLTDVDGTLLDDEKQCPLLNVEAIKKLKDKGIYFGISTGRPVAAVLELMISWDLSQNIDFIIGSNGAEVYHMSTGQLDQYNVLEPQVVRSIAKLYGDLDLAVTAYEGTTLLTNKVLPRMKKQATLHKLNYKLTDFSKIEKSYPKVLLIMEADYQQSVLTHAYALQSSQYRIFASSPVLLECVHPELSKAFGIHKLIKGLGISAKEVLCFGDTTNDLEMLESFVGVCVSNGTQDAKAVSKYETISNNEGGVGHFLNKYIL